MSAAEDAFRADYRAREIGKHYRGQLHFAVTATGALAAIAFALSRVHDVSLSELAIVPSTFLFANVVEYLAHRFLMHVPRPVVRFLYQRHTLQHHRFFVGNYLAAESARDWKIVMFPPALLFFFLGCIGLPLSLGIRALTSENLGALFGATAAGYFLIYECCHLAWHQPEGSLVARLPLVRRFRALHRNHHVDDTRGFNVTFPIADTIFGTE